MNSFDSRLIFPGDNFVQMFSKAGCYRYGFFGLPTADRSNPAEHPFTINVRESPGKRSEVNAQHTVLVRLVCGQLVPDCGKLEVEVGAAVLWHAGDPATPGFSIDGYSDTHSFSSAAMNSESVYIHPFGNAGEFKWRNANGEGPSGTVEVTMPSTRTPSESADHKKRLSTEEVVVVLSGPNVEYAPVKIWVNQTVCFVVEDADGITVTDERLLPAS